MIYYKFHAKICITNKLKIVIFMVFYIFSKFLMRSHPKIVKIYEYISLLYLEFMIKLEDYFYNIYVSDFLKFSIYRVL